MTLKLYHAPLTRSVRVLWLLEEMGLDYELEVVPQAEFRKVGMSAGYRKISPLGKWPVLVDGDQPLLESIAIMDYLMARYGKDDTAGGLHPKRDSIDYGLYQQWMHFGEAGLTTGISMLLGHTMFLPEKQRSAAMAEWARTEVRKCFGFAGDALGNKDYMLGNFTAADISLGYMVFLLRLIGQKDLLPENILEYWQRLKQRPAWQKAKSVN